MLFAGFSFGWYCQNSHTKLIHRYHVPSTSGTVCDSCIPHKRCRTVNGTNAGLYYSTISVVDNSSLVHDNGVVHISNISWYLRLGYTRDGQCGVLTHLTVASTIDARYYAFNAISLGVAGAWYCAGCARYAQDGAIGGAERCGAGRTDGATVSYAAYYGVGLDGALCWY